MPSSDYMSIGEDGWTRCGWCEGEACHRSRFAHESDCPVAELERLEAQRELVARAVAARGTPEDVDADALALLIVDGMSGEAAAKPEPLTWEPAEGGDGSLWCYDHYTSIVSRARRGLDPFISFAPDVPDIEAGKELAALLVQTTQQWRESRGER